MSYELPPGSEVVGENWDDNESPSQSPTKLNLSEIRINEIENPLTDEVIKMLQQADEELVIKVFQLLFKGMEDFGEEVDLTIFPSRFFDAVPRISDPEFDEY